MLQVVPCPGRAFSADLIKPRLFPACPSHKLAPTQSAFSNVSDCREWSALELGHCLPALLRRSGYRTALLTGGALRDHVIRPASFLRI
eukprot:SAG11_NODE_19632_length_462_cov_1.154270_1_plen_87_part_10